MVHLGVVARRRWSTRKTMTPDQIIDLGIDLTDPSGRRHLFEAVYTDVTRGEYPLQIDYADADGYTGSDTDTLIVAADVTPPVISNFSVTKTLRTINVSFDADEPLSEIEITVDRDGTPVTALTENPAMYLATIDGVYTLTLTKAVDRFGNDGAAGETGSVEIATTPPTGEYIGSGYIAQRTSGSPWEASIS